MAYTNHKFCWHGIVTTDVEKATAFYPEVLGWSLKTIQMGDNEALFFAIDDVPHCHVTPPPMEGVPSHWNNYLRVDDVDASTRTVVANGGKELVAPNDIAPGRFSVVASPSGATFTLFHEADPSAQNLAPADGRIHWTELHSTNLDADLAWLKASFGYTTEEMPIPGGTYYVLKSGDQPCGGAMNHMKPEAPSMWLTWVQVSNVDETAARVTGHGGQLLGDIMEMPGVGRMVVAQDPTGGVFGIITPSAG